MDLITVLKTDEFLEWVKKLRDPIGRSKIVQRIERAELGLLGDVKSLGGQVSEMRIDYGPGYRLYFTRKGHRLIWLLCGGDKGSQSRDIAKARTLASEVED